MRNVSLAWLRQKHSTTRAGATAANSLGSPQNGRTRRCLPWCHLYHIEVNMWGKPYPGVLEIR
eukprot:229670-Amphidinium_carterae.1